MMYQERDWSKTPRILVIDDKRTFKFEATYARNIGIARTLLYFTKVPWDEIWLDHDLGGEETVMELVDHIEESAFNGRHPHVGTFVIHSSNPVGRERMKQALEKFYTVRMVRAEDYM